jgi:2-amino-4-hydroxy-6-hydroxymethyldihydropteridine diphosphokinase
MHTIFLALGSNVGDSVKNITQAINLLNEKVFKIKRAALYSTSPVGYLAQADFINTAISGQTELSPREVLSFIKNIEQKIGRIKRFKWGPREIDIDVLFYDDLTYTDEILTLPHPLLHHRDFVLQPLAELAAHFKHPTLKKSVAELLANIPEQERSVQKILTD